MRALTSNARILALLGNPVDHSFSPVIQNAAFRETGMDGVYVSLRCEEKDLLGFMDGLVRSGGGGNITIPHKEKAVYLLDEYSEAVERTGACNTFWGIGGKIYGDNTDVEGFRRALRYFLGESPKGLRVLLIGAGGAARAVLVALLDDGVEDVLILNRSTERAQAVVRLIGRERVRVAGSYLDIRDNNFDLVVNATSLGLDLEDQLPVDLSNMGSVGLVMDLVYRTGITPFIKSAESLGIRAMDGREMLIQQGVVAFERWWGTPGPVETMRHALADTITKYSLV
jgi:shikimate dehydrogenase